MGLEEVKEEILNSARNNSSDVIEEAKKEAQQIIIKAKTRVNEYKKKLEDDKSKLIENLEKMKVAQARSEAKKLVLEKKKEIIEGVFEQIKQKLAALNDSERKKYIQKLIEKAKDEIEIATVYCNKKDKRLLQDFKCEEASIIGGIMVENKNKSVRVDYSFETLLSNIKESSLQEIAKILF